MQVKPQGSSMSQGVNIEVKEKDKIIATESSRKKKLKSTIIPESVISTRETRSSSSVILTKDLGMDLGDYIQLPSPNHSNSGEIDCTDLSEEDEDSDSDYEDEYPIILGLY